MHKMIYAIAAFGALACSDAAWAVLQETAVTLTDNGKPIPEAKITLNRITDSEPPPQPKTEKTDDSGKVVVVHDEKDKKSDSTVELIVTTSEGKTLTRRVVLRDLLTRESVDVTSPSEGIAECPDLTRLDESHFQTILTGLTDQQLQTVVDNPELRTRILKLINTSKQTEETQETSTEKQTHHPSKTVVERKTKKLAEHKQHVTRSKPSESRVEHPLLSTGVGIGLGIGRGTIGGHHGMGDHHGGGPD